MDAIEIIQATLDDPQHADAVVAMIDAYSRDPSANGAPLAADVVASLMPGLRAHPGAVVFLALCEGAPVGIAVCFVGFSTFAARPLLNVHDLSVVPTHRGRGISVRLLEAAEGYARARGFCKVTLEVQENNARARGVYDRFGFESYELDPALGRALMMQKKL